MLNPSRITRQTFPGTNRFMGAGSPQGKNNLILGVTALVGITGLVYWMGYKDVGQRHTKQDGLVAGTVVG